MAYESEIGVRLRPTLDMSGVKRELSSGKLSFGVDEKAFKTSLKNMETSAKSHVNALTTIQTKLYKGLNDLQTQHASQKKALLDKQFNEEKVYGSNVGAIRVKYLKQFTELDKKQADERIKLLDDKRVEAVNAKKSAQHQREEEKKTAATKRETDKRIKLEEQASAKEESILLKQAKKDEELKAKRIKSDAEMFAKKVKLSEDADRKIGEQGNRRAKNSLSSSFASRVTSVGASVNSAKGAANDASALKADRDRQSKIENQFFADRKRLQQTSTKELVALAQKNTDEKLVIERKLSKGVNAIDDAMYRERLKDLKDSNKDIRAELTKRPDVQRHGAGVGAGILGTGRNLISQSGLPMSGMLMKGGAIGAGVGLAVAGIKESIQSFAEYETALADLSAITGIKGKDLDAFGSKARQMGMAFGIDATEAIGAFKLVVSALGTGVAKDQPALTSMANSVLTLAKASGVDAATAADTLTRSLNQFGLATGTNAEKAKEMNRIMNVMAAGSLEGAAEVGDLGASILEVGATAKRLGIDVESATGALEILSQSGIKGASAGTAYRNVLTYMSSGTKEAQKALQEMGLAFKDINPAIVGQEVGLSRLQQAFSKVTDKTKEAEYMEAIFRRENQNVAVSLMNSTVKADGQTSALTNMTKAVTGTNTAAEQARIKQETLTEAWNRFGVEMKDVAISVGESLKPLLVLTTQLLNKISGFIQGVTKAGGMTGGAMGIAMKDANTGAAKIVQQFEEARGIAKSLFTGGSGMITPEIMNNFKKEYKKVFSIEGELSQVQLKAMLSVLSQGQTAFAKSTSDARDERLRAQDDAFAELRKMEEDNAKLTSGGSKKTNDEAIAEEERKLNKEKTLRDIRAKNIITNDDQLKAVLLESERIHLQSLLDMYVRFGEAKKIVAAIDAKDIFEEEHGKTLGTVSGNVEPKDVRIFGTKEYTKQQYSSFDENGNPIRTDDREGIVSDLDNADKKLNELNDTASQMGSSVMNQFISPLIGGLLSALGIADNFFGFILGKLAELAANSVVAELFKGLLSIIPGGGILSAIFGGLFGGGKAEGGDINRGKFYITGEHAPELVDYTGSTPKIIPLTNKSGSDNGAMNPMFAPRGIGGQNKQSLRIGKFQSATGGTPIESKRQDETDLGVDESLRIGKFQSVVNNGRDDFYSQMGSMISTLNQKVEMLSQPIVMPVPVYTNRITKSQRQSGNRKVNTGSM